jgi:phosphoglycolate phosphatase
MQHDIETAKHGGIHSCAVLTGYNTLEQLREMKPDLIVEHLGELRRVLEQNDLRLKPETEKFEETHPPLATVGALIFNGAGEVLMIRTHKWSNLWGIPGGKIKWGEPSVAALRREIKEETGLDVTDIEFVLVQDCIHSREFYRDAHFVLLNYTCRCAGKPRVTLNDEARESRWVTHRRGLENAAEHADAHPAGSRKKGWRRRVAPKKAGARKSKIAPSLTWKSFIASACRRRNASSRNVCC